VAPAAAADTAIDQLLMPALTQVLQDSPELAQLSPEELHGLLAEVVAEHVAAGAAA
jgi:hypothetical protein